MSSNSRVYGPGGSYAVMYVPPPPFLHTVFAQTGTHIRAGVDAARAFGTGCFKDHRTHDLRGLSTSELQVRLLRLALPTHTPHSHI